jgi:hypothetical protein
MFGRRTGHRGVALLSGALLVARGAPLQAQRETPNIEVLVAADLGWPDTGVPPPEERWGRQGPT